MALGGSTGDGGGGGGGGGATLIITGSVTADNIEVLAGSGGNAGPRGRGGDGGSATLIITGGTAEADQVIVTSGWDGIRGGGHGGDASFTADTLKAKHIFLNKPANTDDLTLIVGGDLTFHVDTLGVNTDSGNKVLTLNLISTVAGPDGVHINTIELGSGEMVSVVSENYGDFSFDELKVLGAGATYRGPVDSSGKILTFDLTNVVGSDTTPMLTVYTSAIFTVTKIDFIGNPNLDVGDTIILLKAGGIGCDLRPTAFGGSGSSGGTDDYIFGTTGYIFTLDWDGMTETFLLTVNDKYEITITPINTPINTYNNAYNNDSNNNVGVTGFGSGGCVIPVINSISADPILRGAKLTVDAWCGDDCPSSYQWQVEQKGSWVNIPGATSATFFYTGLPKGTYTVRCIVKNAEGETTSDPVTFKVV